MLALHELGVAHGQLDGDRLVIRPDGSAAIGDFGGARVAASDGAMMADRAQVLVTTALVVGHRSGGRSGDRPCSATTRSRTSCRTSSRRSWTATRGGPSVTVTGTWTT